MQSSNPVLTRLGEAAQQERTSYAPGYGAGQPAGYGPGYPSQTAAPRTMTLDDVVVRTVFLLALTGASGAAAWLLLPDTGGVTTLAMIGSAITGLVLALVISFMRVTNPFVISAYALVEGVLLGVVSRRFEAFYDGIVLQAVIGTFGIFAIMAVLYKLRVVRATPRFAKMVIGALVGVVVLMFANLLFNLFGGDLGIRAGMTGEVGALPIIFSIVVVVIGALTFVLDFDQVEQATRYGLPEKYAWYCSFGILVGLIFLYFEILRLLSYLRR